MGRTIQDLINDATLPKKESDWMGRPWQLEISSCELVALVTEGDFLTVTVKPHQEENKEEKGGEE